MESASKVYTVVKTDKKILLSSGSNGQPIITLESEYEDRAQIIVDDNCYVLCVANRVGTYNTVKRWFPEAITALHEYLLKNK